MAGNCGLWCLGPARRRGMALVVAGFALAAAPAGAADEGRLDCHGPVARTDDETALVARYGRAKVVSADLDGAEGSTERGTVIFPKDPSRRIEIFWQDGSHRRRPASVRVRGRSGWALTTPGGPVSVGAGLGAVEAANGRPFTLIGFGWDMGGYGGGWRGGALERLPGGCFLSLRFDPDPKAPASALDRVSGDRRFSSADPRLRAVTPTVSQVSVDWPD